MWLRTAKEMDLKMRVINHLLKSVRDAAVFNPDVQVAPACILWPDKDRQWEAVIPRLQEEMPELLVLGDYAPEKRTGPAIWLRCVIAGAAKGVDLPSDRTPIFYLPGVSRQDLRAVEGCPEHLKALAELQYRGAIWSQLNGKDWTILAFLKTDQGGLGLDVAQDNDAKNAMQLALYLLLDEEVVLLNGKRLDKDYFNTLLTGGDPVRDLLQWLDQGDAFRAGRSENEWPAFVEVCKSQFAFDPQNDGVLAGAARLAMHEGPWKAIWERFCEAPRRYPNIPARIRQSSMPPPNLFANEITHGGWPQWNDAKEKMLHKELQGLRDVPVHESRERLLSLERQHGNRRSLVWAELGEAPLAKALGHLAILAEVTRNGLAAGTVEDLAAGYRGNGWRADDAVIRALAEVETEADLAVVTTAIRAVYLPWAEESARHLQQVVHNSSYPGGTLASLKAAPYKEGECLLFVDGLRFDTAKRLLALLENKGCIVSERPCWVPLPSVTGTGKPAVAPILGSNQVSEEPGGYNFEPITAYLLRKTIVDKGWQFLERGDNGAGHGHGWCEFGDIDHEGHDRGWKLARHLGLLLEEISGRILALLAAGWKGVRVVTDHGWLLMPGGLPKTELAACLADSKWGRCAALKSGATTEEKMYPWYWNPGLHFALADGVSCFRRGEEYAHGGLSLQECLTLELTVTGTVGAGSLALVEITDVVWKGLRCSVAVEGDSSGLAIDLRMQAGDAKSSVLLGKKAKALKGHGTASVVVEDEDLLGQEATLVVVDDNGGLVAQANTMIGGGIE